jgi:hypothetical protein
MIEIADILLDGNQLERLLTGGYETRHSLNCERHEGRHIFTQVTTPEYYLSPCDFICFQLRWYLLTLGRPLYEMRQPEFVIYNCGDWWTPYCIETGDLSKTQHRTLQAVALVFTETAWFWGNYTPTNRQRWKANKTTNNHWLLRLAATG